MVMADRSYLDPPPNNAGLGGIGSRHIGHTSTSAVGNPTPKKKTLEFEHLEVSYDYDTSELRVVAAGGNCLVLNPQEVNELRTAMLTLGIGIVPPGDGVTCR